MKKIRPLTSQEQEYAADHHTLVWKFLHSYDLPEADFYDVIIFGYLLAVQEYVNSPRLQKQYAFSTIAWQNMHNALVDDIIYRNRPKRNADVVEYTDAMALQELDQLLPHRMEAIEEQMHDADIVKHLLSYSTPKERHVFELRSEGYTYREISEYCGISVRGVSSRVSRFRNRIANTPVQLGGERS
ncbi:MAG: sigma-70 family RNA polymerase sigma factor [Hespellia sp.]|nr:sigma-70 family RNA polymerase sigma factor [Hespellia sp.]